MNRIIPVLFAAGLAATWVGCNTATDSSVATVPAGAGQSSSTDYTLVTLKVPNMT